MADVRAKLTVTQMVRNSYNPQHAEIKLEAQYTGKPEDHTYSEATPTASMTMYVSNPEAVEKLPLGKSFYVDFTAAE